MQNSDLPLGVDNIFKTKDVQVCIINTFYFFSIFKTFLYYEIIKPIYDSANLCKRLTESEHKMQITFHLY